MNEIINIKDVEAKVLTIRQQAVLLAQDVAELYMERLQTLKDGSADRA